MRYLGSREDIGSALVARMRASTVNGACLTNGVFGRAH